MPIETRCSHCQAAFRVPATAVGKKTKCPKCQQPFTVAAKVAANGPAAASTSSASGGQWYAKAPDDQQYGPISRAELDTWAAEGRVGADWQLLREGDKSWQWASEVYPDLQQTQREEAPPAISVDTGSSSISRPTSTPSIDAGTSGKYRPTFRARQYPAMRFVSIFFYCLAGLAALSLVLSLIFVAMTAGGGMLAAVGGNDLDAAAGGGAMMMAVMMGIVSLIYHGMLIAMFVYAAESVRIVIDIQQNTQETAHYTKHAQ